jgi:hypothetical protein
MNAILDRLVTSSSSSSSSANPLSFPFMILKFVYLVIKQEHFSLFSYS